VKRQGGGRSRTEGWGNGGPKKIGAIAFFETIFSILERKRKSKKDKGMDEAQRGEKREKNGFVETRSEKKKSKTMAVWIVDHGG